MQRSPKQSVVFFLRAIGVFLAASIAISLWLDPFWAWQKSPPWQQWRGGYNWNLDTRMRSAKPLQLLLREADTILLGSSRVVHGINPTSHYPRSYNFGISGLRIAELEGYTHYILNNSKPKRIIIGLDYFMFDARHITEAGYNPNIGKPYALIEAIPAAIFSHDAWHGAWLALSGKGAREGVWHANGYNERFAVDAAKANELLEQQRENLGRVVINEAGYASLTRALALIHANNITVQLYLSPMHPSQFALLAEDNATERFDAWRARVNTIASAQNILLHDFTQTRFDDEDALLKTGSTSTWIDPSHFSPKVGEWILKEISSPN